MIFMSRCYIGSRPLREDRNDCAVRALFVATWIPRREIRRELARRGRRRHAPVDVFTTFAETAETMGGEMWTPPRPMSLRRFIRGPGARGAWVLFSDSAKHMFATRDGVVHDWSYHPGRRIDCAWRF